MYTVVGTRASRAFRILWMLEELGQPYEHIPAAPRSAEAAEANPSGKIPSLIVDGATLTDSSAILTFLADRHDNFTFSPGTVERGRQDAMSHMILDELDGALWCAARNTFVLPEEKRVPAVKDTLKWEYGRSLDRIAAAFEGPHLMGETMTVPDILLTHCFGWAEKAGFPAPEGTLAEYLGQMRAREAFGRASALP